VRKRLWRDPVPPRAIDPNPRMAAGNHPARAGGRPDAKRYQTAAQMLFDLQHPQQVKLTERAAS
jgi:hypothetical protein